MKPQTYRFFIDAGTGKLPVKPIYKADLSKDYELETSQQFFRGKLSGKLTLVRNDFDLINNASFETEFLFYIERSKDLGLTWESYFRGKFMKTDCQFNLDDKNVTVQPDLLDEYNDVLAGMENEYDLIPLAPEITPLALDKRPLIQTYIPGDSVISSFLGGMNWEQDCEVITDVRALRTQYYFDLSNLLREMRIKVNGTPIAIDGLYSGKMALNGQRTAFVGNLDPEIKTGYHVYCTQSYIGSVFSTATVEIQRDLDNAPIFRYTINLPNDTAFENAEFDMQPVLGSGATGTAHVEMATHRVYTRYLLDVVKIGTANTYPIPAQDITDNNRNYHYVIPYAVDVAYISNNHSITPTQWGLANDGRYFLPPYSYGGVKFYPLSPSRWRYTSIWFAYDPLNFQMEQQGRKTYTLRDANPIYSIISVLLKQIAPNITHEGTPEYSQFLYGNINPISGDRFRIFSTQKSNILAGEYSQAAQKAKTTLKQFTDMLRDVFRCYWFIEDGKFKIEHIKFFHNGGTYSGAMQIQEDLTALLNPKGKPWGYNSSAWEYEKVSMAERYEFAWMDDVTLPFEGYPIEIVSKYVNRGKKESVDVSGFSSDIDYMLLNPTEISNDGFALLAGVYKNLLDTPIQSTIETGDGYIDFDGTIKYDPNGIGMGWKYYKYKVIPDAVYTLLDENGNQIDGVYWHFYEEDGTTITRVGSTTGVVRVSDDCYILGLSYRAQTNANPTTLPVLDFNTVAALEQMMYSLPYITRNVEDGEVMLQNGLLAFIDLQPKYYTYDLPARHVIINKQDFYCETIEKYKKQEITYPTIDDPDPQELIKTFLGNGQIDKISVNLSNRISKVTLKYDTEQ